MPPSNLPYRDFYYPLNIFMHILTHEEGRVRYLHYGLFESENEPIDRAQEHSTELLLSRLPPPPARLLEVGIGLGTTLARLAALGYEVTGITPDDKQIAMVRQSYGSGLRIGQVAFQDFFPQMFDMVVFQESAQYIPAEDLFAKAREISNSVLVLDEFSTRAGDTLHGYAEFVAAAARYGFAKKEEIDLSARAAPTVDYFAARIHAYRDRLLADLGVANEQIDDLLASGQRYRQSYANGSYVYRLLRFERPR